MHLTKLPHLLCLLSLVLFAIIGCGSDDLNKNVVSWEKGSQIVGKWEAPLEGRHKIILEFAEDGHMGLSWGVWASFDISQKLMSYHLDASKTPTKLDFVFSARSNDEFGPLKLIAQFITKNKLKIRLQDGPDRPERFQDDHRNEITFQRVIVQ